MSTITDRCAALAAEGYSVTAVMIARAGNNRLRVNIVLSNFVPLGEGGDLPRHAIEIDMDKVPDGVTVSGSERVQDEVIEIVGGDEQADAIIREVARVGKAKDWARFDGDGKDYPHWLTKPNAWRRK